MLIAVAAATFVTVFLITLALYRIFLSGRQKERERIRQFVINPLPPSSVITDNGAGESKNSMPKWRAIVRYLSRYTEYPRWSRAVEHKLLQAGIPLKSSEFGVICFVSTFIAAGLFHILAKGNLLAALIGAALGYLLPVAFIKIKIQRRTKAFNDQMGDALVLVANSLRTGYSFMQALDMVTKEMPPPISVEFGRVLKEINLGVTTEDAMNNLAKRIDSDDLDLVITAVLIQRQVGGNLAEVLDNIAATIRGRIKLKREIKTLTAQGRISGIIISLLPVGIGLIIQIINPEYVNVLFTHTAGKIMLAGAAVSQLLGIMFIRGIVNIEM